MKSVIEKTYETYRGRTTMSQGHDDVAGTRRCRRDTTMSQGHDDAVAHSEWATKKYSSVDSGMCVIVHSVRRVHWCHAHACA